MVWCDKRPSKVKVTDYSPSRQNEMSVHVTMIKDTFSRTSAEPLQPMAITPSGNGAISYWEF